MGDTTVVQSSWEQLPTNSHFDRGDSRLRANRWSCTRKGASRGAGAAKHENVCVANNSENFCSHVSRKMLSICYLVLAAVASAAFATGTIFSRHFQRQSPPRSVLQCSKRHGLRPVNPSCTTISAGKTPRSILTSVRAVTSSSVLMERAENRQCFLNACIAYSKRASGTSNIVNDRHLFQILRPYATEPRSQPHDLGHCSRRSCSVNAGVSILAEYVANRGTTFSFGEAIRHVVVVEPFHFVGRQWRTHQRQPHTLCIFGTRSGAEPHEWIGGKSRTILWPAATPQAMSHGEQEAESEEECIASSSVEAGSWESRHSPTMARLWSASHAVLLARDKGSTKVTTPRALFAGTTHGGFKQTASLAEHAAYHVIIMSSVHRYGVVRSTSTFDRSWSNYVSTRISRTRSLSGDYNSSRGRTRKGREKTASNFFQSLSLLKYIASTREATTTNGALPPRSQQPLEAARSRYGKTGTVAGESTMERSCRQLNLTGRDLPGILSGRYCPCAEGNRIHLFVHAPKNVVCGESSRVQRACATREEWHNSGEKWKSSSVESPSRGFTFHDGELQNEYVASVAWGSTASRYSGRSSSISRRHYIYWVDIGGGRWVLDDDLSLSNGVLGVTVDRAPLSPSEAFCPLVATSRLHEAKKEHNSIAPCSSVSWLLDSPRLGTWVRAENVMVSCEV